ncbi:MAG: hypothetical protein RIS92_1675 [Verrucomicrobiota bacterium]|jgi:hypothetical protein
MPVLRGYAAEILDQTEAFFACTQRQQTTVGGDVAPFARGLDSPTLEAKKGACVWCRLAWTGLHYCLFLNPSSIAACLGTHANRLPESEKFGLRRSVFLAHDRVMSRGVRGYFPAGNISADFITSYVHVLTPLSGLVGMRRLRTPVGTRRLF